MHTNKSVNCKIVIFYSLLAFQYTVDTNKQRKLGHIFILRINVLWSVMPCSLRDMHVLTFQRNQLPPTSV